MTTTTTLGWDPKDPLIRARSEKLERWRETYGITGYGSRIVDRVPLAEARSRFDEAAHQAHVDDADAADTRPRVVVAGRCMQHRAMGKLVFLVLRDDTGDLQISVSKAAVAEPGFKLAQKLDYGDIVVAEGPVGKTQKGEICVWAERFEVHAKSLVPPPEKFHGLTDAELRYRRRYVDMFANPATIQTMRERSRIMAETRLFMEARAFLEVETPMMQPLAGGAAARPFVTHHNALDMPLYLRIAPELYLKRLLVGGMPRVYEINRNFRNEGVDRSHNPEFTSMEVYEAFGDCWTMLDLTESLLRTLAESVAQRSSDLSTSALPFGDIAIDWAQPFTRVAYGDLFEKILGFPMTDVEGVRAEAARLRIDDAATRDAWLLVNEVYERRCEDTIDPTRPTFVTDYPSVISPLTRPQAERPELCDRWELIIGGMEIGTAYTELNDPGVQYEKLTAQLSGADEEEQAFRTLDEDFLLALRVGMPPAGGLGLGFDRIVMLMTNNTSIRDVILFPLLRPDGAAEPVGS